MKMKKVSFFAPMELIEKINMEGDEWRKKGISFSAVMRNFIEVGMMNITRSKNKLKGEIGK